MPSGYVTLLESAKTMPIGVPRGVVMTYALAYQPMTVLPLLPEPSGVHNWNLEMELPYTTGGVRNINGSWTASRSSVSAYTDTFKIYGGEVKIDRAIAETNPAKVPQERESQIKAQARQFTKDMFEGTGGSSLRGIKDWIDNDPSFSTQSSNVGTASTGALLTTDHLDKLLSMGNIEIGRSFIYCTDNIGLRVRKLSRGNSVSGDTAYANRFTPEQWGYFAGMYADVPVIVLKDGKGSNLLSATQGDGSSSSVYLVTYGENMFTGYQVSPMKVISLTQADVYNYFDVEWYVGAVPKSIRSIARLQYVIDSVS